MIVQYTVKTSPSSLSVDMLEDVYSVHKAFLFGYHRFRSYSLQDFVNNLRSNVGISVDDIIVNNMNTINLNPSFLINDDMFTIWNQLFIASKFVHCLKNDKQIKSIGFTLQIFVIPRKITFIYNPNVTWNLKYLLNEYWRDKQCSIKLWPSSTDLTTIIQTLSPSAMAPHCLILIDRRTKTKGILTANTQHKLKVPEFESNYNLGLCFKVSPPNSITTCHLYYGQHGQNKLRFYPEHLTTIIPRFFKKNASIRPYQSLQQLYADSFKHGFCCDLTDPSFNLRYRQMTGYLHISNNYNRRIMYEDDNKETKEDDKVSELDIIIWTKRCNKTSVREFPECPFTKYIITVLCKFRDLNYTGIEVNDFDAKKIIAAYNHIMEIHDVFLTHETREKTQKYFVSKVKECKYDNDSCICLAQHTLRGRFGDIFEDHPQIIGNTKDSSLIILINQLNSLHSYLIHSGNSLFRIRRMEEDEQDADYQHKHQNIRFTTTAQQARPQNYMLDIDAKIELGEYVVLKINQYTKEPLITRDNFFDNIEVNLGIIEEWIDHEEYDSDALEYDMDEQKVDSLRSNICAMMKDNDQQEVFNTLWKKYINVYDKNIVGIDFGDSVLNWSSISDDKTNYTMDEIAKCLLNGLNKYEPFFRKPAATIKQWIEQCKLEQKIYNASVNHGYRWKISELLCLRAYTNTNELCSKFRSSFWKINSQGISGSGSTLRDEFWIWALLMYKTHLYHAKPIIPYTVKSGQPIDLYHGLNQLFAIENKSPLYNGPVSTTAERSVAHKFSNGEGLLWYINHNYYSPYRLITGIDVTKISQYKGESEILLNNQHITIAKTINFASELQEKVDQVLYQLQIYKTVIKDEKDVTNFWNSIGLQQDEIMRNQAIHSIILNHPLLLKKVAHDEQQTVIERVVGELKLSTPELLLKLFKNLTFEIHSNWVSHPILSYQSKNASNDQLLSINIKQYMFSIDPTRKTGHSFDTLKQFEIQMTEGNLGYDLFLKSTKDEEQWILIKSVGKTIKPEQKYGTYEYDGLLKEMHNRTISISSKSIIDASEYGLTKEMTQFYKEQKKGSKEAVLHDQLLSMLDEKQDIIIKHGGYLGDNHENKDNRMERGGGVICLESKYGDIINNGMIKSLGTNDQYSRGDVVISCKNGIFRNYGEIHCSNLIIIAKDVDIDNGIGHIDLTGNKPKIFSDDEPKFHIYNHQTKMTSESKIGLEYVDHKGHVNNDAQNHPRNLLDSNGILTHYFGLADEDWMIIRMSSKYAYPTKILIANSASNAAIRNISIYVPEKTNQQVWHQLDSTKNNQESDDLMEIFRRNIRKQQSQEREQENKLKRQSLKWHKLASIKNIEQTQNEREYDLSVSLTHFFVSKGCDQIIKIVIDDNYGSIYNEFHSLSLYE